MSICDRCIHDEVCGLEGNHEEAIAFCSEIMPKIGHWRHYEGMLTCSECGAEFYDEIMEYCGDDVPKCCPNCGAKMQEVEE